MKWYCEDCDFTSNNFWSAVFHGVKYFWHFVTKSLEQCESFDNFYDKEGYRCDLKKGHVGIHSFKHQDMAGEDAFYKWS